VTLFIPEGMGGVYAVETCAAHVNVPPQFHSCCETTLLLRSGLWMSSPCYQLMSLRPLVAGPGLGSEVVPPAVLEAGSEVVPAPLAEPLSCALKS
jgi:hypothetical protein